MVVMNFSENILTKYVAHVTKQDLQVTITNMKKNLINKDFSYAKHVLLEQYILF